MASYQQEVAGQPTQIVVQPFADRILVLITQVGKVGNLVQASLPSTAPTSVDPDAETGIDSLPQPSPAIQLTPLLGTSPSDHHQTLHSLYASQIATIIWESPSQSGFDGSRRDVVVGLALKVAEAGIGYELSEAERATFRGIIRMLQEILKCEQA